MRLLYILILVNCYHLTIAQLDSGIYIIQLSGTEYFLSESKNIRKSNKCALSLDTLYRYFILSKNESGTYLISDMKHSTYLACTSASLSGIPELIFSERYQSLAQNNISRVYCNTWQIRKESRSENGFELIPTCFSDYVLSAQYVTEENNGYNLMLEKRNIVTNKKLYIWNFSKINPASRKRGVKYRPGAQLPDIYPK